MNKRGQRIEQYLGVVALVVLLLGCLIVMRPFMSAFLWAVVLCFSSWPIYQRLLKLVRGRRTLAAFLMTLGLILVVLLPFVVIGATLADNVKDLTAAARNWIDAGLPQSPAWLAKLPLIGQSATDYWQSVAHDSAKLLQDLKRFIEPAGAILLKVGIALGRGLVQLALSIFVAFFFFRDGVAVGERLSHAVERIGGERGKHLLGVAGNMVRGVVYGILGTALVQGVTAGIGFAIAGVPGAALLALLTFFLSVVPVGPPLVWIPAALWLFNQGRPGWGIFMLIWGVGVSSVDNLVKPWLISQGSNLPFILIFFGVLGGALAFGFIGVFLGPTLLAVGYSVVKEWASPNGGATPELDTARHSASSSPSE